MQSNDTPANGPHVAIIMDGNGRWATRRGLSRSAGHRAGIDALRRIVEAAPGAGIATLTVFAFSADNWRRPKPEVDGLMALLGHFLAQDVTALVEAQVRLTIVGRRDRLTRGLRRAIGAAERATARGDRLHLRVAIDYSARDAIIGAATALRGGAADRVAFAAALADASGASPDVDLLIRTGGERRLSDFLLWECAYAELTFVDLMWPDFGPQALDDAMADFAGRDRRFGGLAAPVPHAA